MSSGPTEGHSPSDPPPFVTAYFDAVDHADLDALAGLLAPDVRFRMTNNAEVAGRYAVLAGGKAFEPPWDSTKHKIIQIGRTASTTYVELLVEYQMKDGSAHEFPFFTVFEDQDGVIASVRVFGDNSPLFRNLS